MRASSSSPQCTSRWPVHAPAVSIPCGFTTAALPVGLQLVGRPFEDAFLLAVARAYEERHPWSERRPPVPGP